MYSEPAGMGVLERFQGETFPYIGDRVLGEAGIGLLRRTFAEGREEPNPVEGDAISLSRLLEAKKGHLVSNALVAFCQSPAMLVAKRLFEGRVCILLANCVGRLHRPGGDPGDPAFQLDGDLLDEAYPVMTFWIPLTEPGDNAQGPTFLAPSVDPAILVDDWRSAPRGGQDGQDPPARVRYRPQDLERLYGRPFDEITQPVVLPGGAYAAFHQLVPYAHRQVPAGDQPLESYEVCLCDRRRVPPEYRQRGGACILPVLMGGKWHMQFVGPRGQL